MGSLRNPIGPLPSSIYWRRRVFILSALAVLALVVAWIAASGGGGGKKTANESNGKNPVHTITPGPTPSGSAISQHPGGREESGSGDAGGSDTGPGDSGGSGSTDGSGSDGGSGSRSASSSGGGSVSTGATLPASSGLRDCTAGAVTLSLRSVHNSYSPDQTPAFELTAKNSSGSDCKVDLGPKSAVLTISQSDDSDTYWSSADCPKGPGSLVYRVPAGSRITYTVKWDRKPSAPRCATPAAGSAGAGTYLLEAEAAGFSVAPTSFVLSAD